MFCVCSLLSPLRRSLTEGVLLVDIGLVRKACHAITVDILITMIVQIYHVGPIRAVLKRCPATSKTYSTSIFQLI